MIQLYTTFYEEKNESRLSEFYAAIINNLDLEEIDRIYIFNENGNLQELLSYKLKAIPVNKRPTYKEFIDVINKNTGIDDINIIANTDIGFDKNIGVLNSFEFNNTCIALSRWEFNTNGKSYLYNHNDSQDTWIFQGKMEYIEADFPIGIPRCDNRFMYELKKVGYKVINPAFSIKTYHHHKGLRKKYSFENLSHFVEPPYAYLYPHNLFGFWKTILFNMTHYHKLARYRYDIKKVNFWIFVRLFRKFTKVFFKKDMPLIGYK